MNVGDRFLNIVTGTIIEITNKRDEYVLYHREYDNWNNRYNEQYVHYTYLTVTNINDDKKTKDLPIEQLMEYIRIANGRIVPYHGEPIKPIQYLKQHTWEQQY